MAFQVNRHQFTRCYVKFANSNKDAAAAEWIKLLIKHKLLNKSKSKWPQIFHDEARRLMNVYNTGAIKQGNTNQRLKLGEKAKSVTNPPKKKKPKKKKGIKISIFSILPDVLLQKIISNLNIIDLVPFSISSKNNQILFSKLSVPQSIIDNELNKEKPNYKQLIGILKSRRICVNNNNKELDLSKLNLIFYQILKLNLPDLIQNLIDILNSPFVKVRIASSNSNNIFELSRYGAFNKSLYKNESLSSVVYKFQNLIANNVPIYEIEWSDNWISNDLQKSLRKSVDNFADNSSIDYHPHCDNIVRDILHPSLYPLIRNYNGKDYSHLMNNEFNFLGRSFGRLKNSYQWLPIDVQVNNNYNCKFISPLNNIDIQNDKTNKFSQALIENLEQLLSCVLKPMERVYLNMVKHRMDSAEITTDVVGYYENFEEQLDLYNKSFYKSEKYKHPQSLRNRNIQVVPKIAEYHFDGNNEKKNEFIGVWHMEAMPAENIILTAVYVLDRNENIYGGDIIYKRHLFRNEWQEAMEWGQNRFSYYMQKWLEPKYDYRRNIIKKNRNYLAPNVDCGFTPLGTLPTPKGRCCVFPNYAIHKVNEMGIENGNGKGKRRIIVFFLIDPTIRIASSRDIPLINERGISYYEACVHRIKLMRERAQQKNVYNTGLGYSLCEH